ncbi:MAG: TldD/PmbA family protein [Candidatus Zixiibacteriota bacterium]|nr:MAG: TldD/PmbA family protein [candidate division Zixibacteria bacterium]
MEFTEKILDKCLDAGADSAEVFSLNQKKLSLTVREGRLETIQKSTPGGLAVRFFKDNKTAFAHTTDLSEKSVNEMVRTTKNMAAKTEPDELAVLPDPGQYGRDLDIFDDSRANIPTEAKIAYLVNLEKLAMDYDILIDKSKGAWCSEVLSEIELLNSNGIKSIYKSSHYNVGISVIASKNGNMFPGEGFISARHFSDLLPAEKIVDRYVSRALRLVGGTPVSGGDYEIIFTPYVPYTIMWGLGFALNGENALKGTSFLAGKKGEAFADSKLNVYDDAIKPRGVSSRPADHEGVPSQNNKLVENGVLTGYLYDTRTAARAGEKSTGSAIRDDYNANPEISPSNFYIAPGDDKTDDVIKSCKKGIMVEAVHGWGLNSVNGQYSAGINGILVRNGKMVKPVANVTVAANAEDFFKGIGAVCDDITFYHGFSLPTIMIKKMKVGA